MNKIDFRDTHPKRTSTLITSNYRDFKSDLRKDFNGKCGYTDCKDVFLGGISSFHIDHFKPKSKFKELECEYSNLVYACSHVNILKSNDAPEKYLDPCDDDYNEHFYRDSLGRIYPNLDSEKAIYMHRKLKLGLAKYSHIWLLNKLKESMKSIGDAVDSMEDGVSEKQELKNLHFEISRQFIQYWEYLDE